MSSAHRTHERLMIEKQLDESSLLNSFFDYLTEAEYPVTLTPTSFHVVYPNLLKLRISKQRTPLDVEQSVTSVVTRSMQTLYAFSKSLERACF
jgi:hypothetical protein